MDLTASSIPHKFAAGYEPVLIGAFVSVDFSKVVDNAAKEGIDLQEITIQYEGLTLDEVRVLESHQLITKRLPGGGLLAKFPKEGEPLFADKATAVFYLGA